MSLQILGDIHTITVPSYLINDHSSPGLGSRKVPLEIVDVTVQGMRHTVLLL